MEKPYSGRAKVFETIKGLSIEIPPKRNWFLIIFMTGWLGGWLMGEFAVLGMLSGLFGGGIGESFGGFFALFWLIAWTAGGFFAIRSWLWMIAGKEIISFDRNELKISKKAALLYSPKTYDLKEVKNFSLNPTLSSNSVFGANYNKDFWSLGSNGIFKFDYGYKTIMIANGLDEAEGRHILEKIKAKNLIKE